MSASFLFMVQRDFIPEIFGWAYGGLMDASGCGVLVV